MMTLWAIFRSPLMMGGEMRENDEWTLSLLTNAAVLRLIAHSRDAVQLFRNDTRAAWHSFDENGDEYLALFNLSEGELEVKGEFENPSGNAVELWGRGHLLTSDCSAVIPPHGAVLIGLKRT